MKQITIKGSIIVENSMIMEANLFDNLCNNLVKNGFFGKLLQPIFGDKKDAKKLSEYEVARQKMIEEFKKQREAEIKNEIEHKDKMKALQYKQAKMTELVQRKSEEAKKQMERKATEQVAAAEVKKLDDMIKKIDTLSKMSGPATKAELEYLQTVAQEIGDRMPAQAQLANNVVGITAVAYDGVFDGDEKVTPEKLEEKIKKNMKDRFGDDWENNPDVNTPEFRNAVKSWRKTVEDSTNKSNDDMKKEIESSIKSLANNGIPIKTEEELNEQQSKLTELADKVSEIEQERSDCQKNVDEIETKMNDMVKAKEERTQKKSELEAAQKKIEALQGINTDNMSKEDRDKVIDAIGKVKISDYYITKDKGDNASTELDEKKAKAFCDETGISIDEFKKLCGPQADKDKSLADVMKDSANKEISDKICTKAVEHLQGQKQIVDDELKNITNEETTANTEYTELEKQLTTARENLTAAEGKTPEMDISDMQTALGDNYTTPVTTEVVKKAQTSVEKDIERNKKFKGQLEKAKEAAIKSGEKMLQDRKMDDYVNDHPDFKKELDEITPKSPALAKDDKSGQEYMEIDNPDKPGEKIKIYKPQNGDDPENIKRWDDLIAQKDAAIVPDEDAVKKAKEDLDATSEDSTDRDEKLRTYYKAKKQYDVDKRARDAARAKLSQDDIDKLDDADELKKWAEETDEEGNAKGTDNIEDVDDEGADDESEVEDEQAKKDAEDAQKEIDELEKQLTPEQIEKLKNGEDIDTKDLDDDTKAKIKSYKAAQQKLKDATDKNSDDNKKNPARIWKRKRNKSTGKITKRYYYVGNDAKRKENHDSISAREYQRRMNDFKKKKTQKESKNDTRKVIFEKSKWNMTPLFGMKK